MPSSRSMRKASQSRITAARAIAEDLRKNQLRLAASLKPASFEDSGAAEVSPVPMATLSRGGTIVSAAASMVRLFGATLDDMLHKQLAHFITLADQPGFFTLLNACLQSGQTERAQFSMGVPGGPRKVILLAIAPAIPFLPTAAFRAAFIDLDDIEPRQFGPRPPQQNARLIAAIDGIVWEADYPMRFTFVSRQVERILGFSPDSWIRDPDFWRSHIHHDDRDRILEARTAAVRNPADHVLEYRMITAQRKTIWVKDSAVVLAGAPGWIRMCGMITDISDLQYVRENLNRANETLEATVTERTAKMEQSLDAMETLCYGIAHDLKAPIRGIQGFIGILTTDYNDKFDDNARQYAHPLPACAAAHE